MAQGPRAPGGPASKTSRRASRTLCRVPEQRTMMLLRRMPGRPSPRADYCIIDVACLGGVVCVAS